jgi:hypothetical protein
MGTNSEGELVWYLWAPFSSQNDEFLDVAAHLESGILAVGYAFKGVQWAGGEESRLVKTDLDGNLKWDFILGGEGDDRLNSVISLIDGSFVSAGSLGGSGWLVKIGRN